MCDTGKSLCLPGSQFPHLRSMWVRLDICRIFPNLCPGSLSQSSQISTGQAEVVRKTACLNVHMGEGQVAPGTQKCRDPASLKT